MLKDVRHIAEAYATAVPKPPVQPAASTLPVAQSNEEATKEAPKPAVKDWLRLEPGLYPIDTIRKADHTAHVLLQFIYSVCAGPDAVHRVFKTLNKSYKQDKK
jgi:hypothetical protein